MPAPPRRASGAVKKPICLVPLAVHGRCFITAAQPTRTVAGDRPHARPCLRLPPQNFLGLPPPLHLCPRDLPPGAPSTLRDWSLLVGGGLPHRWGPQARDVTHSGVLSSWDCRSPGSSPGARWKHPGARSAFILGAPLGAGRTRCPIAQKGRWKLGKGQLHKGPQAHWALSGVGGWGDPGPGPDQSTPPHSPPQAGTSDTGSSSPRSPWSRRRSGPACTGTAGLWSGSTRSPPPDLLDRVPAGAGRRERPDPGAPASGGRARALLGNFSRSFCRPVCPTEDRGAGLCVDHGSPLSIDPGVHAVAREGHTRTSHDGALSVRPAVHPTRPASWSTVSRRGSPCAVWSAPFRRSRQMSPSQGAGKRLRGWCSLLAAPTAAGCSQATDRTQVAGVIRAGAAAVPGP